MPGGWGRPVIGHKVEAKAMGPKETGVPQKAGVKKITFRKVMLAYFLWIFSEVF